MDYFNTHKKLAYSLQNLCLALYVFFFPHFILSKFGFLKNIFGKHRRLKNYIHSKFEVSINYLKQERKIIRPA